MVKAVYDTASAEPRRAYGLLISLVVPRPIGWIGSYGPDGVANLAPYSFFQAVATNTPVVLFSTGIGEGIVRRFAAEGAIVYLGDVDVQRGQAIAAETWPARDSASARTPSASVRTGPPPSSAASAAASAAATRLPCSSRSPACRRKVPDAAPRHAGSLGGKWTPISPAAMVPSKASVKA